ncbi:MAG: zinc ribbon domain-containing protein [Clostridium paraputrificum]
MENKNMTTCKACGKEIAKGVKKCPHCGKDQRNFFMKHKIISIIAIFIVLGVIGSVTGGKDDSAKLLAQLHQQNQQHLQRVHQKM